MDRPTCTYPIPDGAGKLLRWEALDSWYTPANNFFTINRYGQPALDENTWRWRNGEPFRLQS
jgi:hypothetical protein